MCSAKKEAAWQLQIEIIRDHHAAVERTHAEYAEELRPKGLVCLDHVAYLLATRYLKEPAGSDATVLQQLRSHVDWYKRYLAATVKVTKTFRDACAQGRLTVRDPEARVPLIDASEDPWFSEDLDEHYLIALKEFNANFGFEKQDEAALIKAPYGLQSEPLEPPSYFAVDRAELLTWVNTSGIATQEEMAELLSDTTNATKGEEAKGAKQRAADVAGLGLTTAQIVETFALTPADRWADKLSHINSDGKAYRVALAQRGGRGKGLHIWHPMEFALCLEREKVKSVSQLGASFKKPALAKWADEFDAHIQNLDDLNSRE